MCDVRGEERRQGDWHGMRESTENDVAETEARPEIQAMIAGRNPC